MFVSVAVIAKSAQISAQIAGEAEEVEEAAEVVEATTIFLSGFLKLKKFLTKFSNS